MRISSRSYSSSKVGSRGYHLQYVPGTRSAFRLHSASKTVSQSAGFWKDWRVMLDKSYGAQSIPETITGLKEVAYQRLEWYDLKNDWANGIQDRRALRPFLTSGMLSRRIIARLMWVESFTGIPLLRWASALSMRIRGVKIIG